MGFYNNFNNSQFQFDKIYRSKSAMETAAQSDGIFAGHFVLVKYDIEEQLGIEDAYSYGTNQTTDYQAYRETYDNTIWQKQIYNGEEKYIYITTLNTEKIFFDYTQQILPSGDNIQTNTIYIIPEYDTNNNLIYSAYTYNTAQLEWNRRGSIDISQKMNLTVNIQNSNDLENYSLGQIFKYQNKYYFKNSNDLIQQQPQIALYSDIPTKFSQLTNDLTYLSQANINNKMNLADEYYVNEISNGQLLFIQENPNDINSKRLYIKTEEETTEKIVFEKDIPAPVFLVSDDINEKILTVKTYYEDIQIEDIEDYQCFYETNNLQLGYKTRMNNQGYILENQNNKVTSLLNNPTHNQYPSAKCTYDALEEKMNLVLNINSINNIKIGQLYFDNQLNLRIKINENTTKKILFDSDMHFINFFSYQDDYLSYNGVMSSLDNQTLIDYKGTLGYKSTRTNYYLLENQNNKITSFNGFSINNNTENQYPSAKCVYNALNNKMDLASSLTETIEQHLADVEIGQIFFYRDNIGIKTANNKYRYFTMGAEQVISE